MPYILLTESSDVPSDNQPPASLAKELQSKLQDHVTKSRKSTLIRQRRVDERDETDGPYDAEGTNAQVQKPGSLYLGGSLEEVS